MKQELKEFCKGLNIEYVGIAPIGPYQELEVRWKKRLAKGHVTGFEEKELSKRVDPALTLPDAKSVIVCLFPYLTEEPEAVNLSKSSRSIDYHHIIKGYLEKIAAFLQGQLPKFHHACFVDNGPLADRYLAYLAGLGYFGYHSNLINDQYGSYFFIGYILNNYPFEPDQPLDKTCLQCGRCIQACPGGAIDGSYDINPLRCCSYLTQKKGELTEEEILILQKHPLIFGCDTCQQVCPHNESVPVTPLAAFKENIKVLVDIAELEGISNKEFSRRYKDRAFAWRGKNILLRNSQFHKK